MKIIIVGKGGSGKDYLMQKFKERGFKDAVLCTTRPPREGETAEDYAFVSPEEFEEMDGNAPGKPRTSSTFIVQSQWGDWKYGLSIAGFAVSNVIELTPRYLAQLSPNLRALCFVIYLDIDLETRTQRLTNRHFGDSSLVERRLASDEEQFADYSDYDIRITDPNF